jgi:DNA-binding transcriptional LysR family regulator
VRPPDKPPQGLTGRRVSAVAFAIYASPQYLAGHSDAESLASQDWLAPGDELAGTSVARWMRAAVPQARIVLRTNSLLVLRHAAAAHLGLAALPCYLGDSSDDLVRVHPPIEAMATALWMLTHEDLRRTARVRAFTQFAAAALSRQRALLEGASPLPPRLSGMAAPEPSFAGRLLPAIGRGIVAPASARCRRICKGRMR